MKVLRWFLLGAALASAAGAYAGPSIFAAIPVGTCVATTNTALSTTSEVVFAANSGRKSVTITNNDPTIAIHVRQGATGTTAYPRVTGGGSWSIDVTGGTIWTGTIDAIAVSGTPAISAEECY